MEVIFIVKSKCFLILWLTDKTSTNFKRTYGMWYSQNQQDPKGFLYDEALNLFRLPGQFELMSYAGRLYVDEMKMLTGGLEILKICSIYVRDSWIGSDSIISGELDCAEWCIE